MIIGSCQITLRAPWIHSLKEKRMVVKRIIERSRNKFNVSISEVDLLDIHQMIVIGISSVSNDKKQVEKSLNQVIEFIEGITDAEILEVDLEIDI